MPKQIEIPGTEGIVIAEIETAAEVYIKVRDKRMALTTQEITAKENLTTTVLAHQKELSKNAEGELHYRFGDDLVVILKPGKPKVKVKHEAEEEEDED